MTAASPPSNRWLFGPAPDLLLGCGLLYVVLFAVFVGAGGWWLETSPAWLAPACALFLSLPHYGATLVRVYEHRNDRRAYALFSVYTTIALVVAFAIGAYDVAVGSLLLTVYLTWSPWHYTGQNYGLAVMFLRRRGVPAVGAPKRWLYASFVLSFALTFCVIHESSVWASARSLPQAGPTLHFVPIGIPGSGVLVPVLALAWAAASLVALVLIGRRARPADLLPTGLLMLTQALWFALPAASLHWRLFAGVAPLAANSLGAFLVWIAVGHAVQYLWVTSYYARAGGDWRGTLPWFGKTLAAGALVWTLPVVLMASRPFGAPSYEAGMAFLVASVVNIHHFVLDGAIWKLRSSRIARVLIASGANDDDVVPSSRGWLRAGTWGLAGACAVAAVFVFVQESWLLPRALERGDVGQAAAILERLAWLGRDPANAHDRVAERLVDAKRYAPALTHYQRSAQLLPAARTWGQIAVLEARLGDLPASENAQERVLALEPDNPQLVEWAAMLSERLGDSERAARLREPTRR